MDTFDRATKKSISVFFPCYNDRETIGQLIRDAFFICQKLTDDFEVIVVDDGSTDGSRELLKKLEKKYDFLKLVFHQRNKGYGGALRSGFKATTKDLIFYTDGDGQYDVKELPKLLAKMTDQIDIVNGYKIKRSDAWYRVVIGKTYHWTMKLVFNLHIRDVDCDFRLMRREILNRVNLKHSSGVICVEMIKKIEMAGFRFAQVGVNHYPRLYGQSQFFNFPRIFKVFINLFKLWWELIIYGQKNKS